ncbi:MAG: tail fiber protein [Rickettsiaceae bacterium]|jgi:hypothetical protein|nr:tail fiber protein [Rickettsiaceae bacterium]
MQTVATLAGMAAVADAVAHGGTVQVTHIALGDGSWTPDENATELQNELVRTQVLGAQQIENNIHKISALAEGPEQFFIHEIGVIASYNGTDVLLAVAADVNAIQWKPANQKVPLELLLHFAAFPPGSVTIDATINNNLSLLKPLMQQALANIRNSRIITRNHLKNLGALPN